MYSRCSSVVCDCSNVAKSHDEESSGLKEQIDVEVILTMDHIIDGTVEEE